MIDFNKEVTEELKDPIYRSSGATYTEEPLPTFRQSQSNTKYYAIFKVGAKIKNTQQLYGLERYLNREVEVKHADPSKKDLNKQVYGSDKMAKEFVEYIADAPRTVKSVLGREVLLTSSPGFFKDMDEFQLEKWVEKNKLFLLQEFSNNLRGLYLHRDETVVHLHAVVACKFYDERYKGYKMQHYRYFDGRKKLIEWQDRYSAAMSKDFNLVRGQKTNVDMSYIDIRNVYNSLANPDLDLDPKMAVVKNKLLETKIKNMESKLTGISKLNQELMKDTSTLKEENRLLREELNKSKGLLNYMKEANFLTDKDIQQLASKSKGDSLSL